MSSFGRCVQVTSEPAGDRRTLRETGVGGGATSVSRGVQEAVRAGWLPPWRPDATQFTKEIIELGISPGVLSYGMTSLEPSASPVSAAVLLGCADGR